MDTGYPTYEQLSDGELCDLALAGRPDGAFREISARYRDRIYRLALGYTKDADDAEDIVQRVWIRAYRSMPRFRRHSGLYTWLYRIAVNCCKDWVKQAHIARYDRKEGPWWTGRQSGDALFTSTSRAESGLERREAAETLATALQSLAPEFRDALVLREIDGLSYREIGQVQACTEGTVKSRISRARTRLKAVLERMEARG